MELLKKRYERKGKKVATLSFPMYNTFFGDYVGRYLAAKDGIPADSVDGKSMALWFALDRFEAFSKLEYLDCDYLLINRYVLSNAVYQSIRDRDADSPDILDFVFALEYEHFGIPRADLSLVLDMDPACASNNVDKKGYREYVGNAKDVYESLDSIQTRARNKYLEYAKRLNNVRVIPCMNGDKLRSILEVSTLIDTAIMNHKNCW